MLKITTSACLSFFFLLHVAIVNDFSVAVKVSLEIHLLEFVMLFCSILGSILDLDAVSVGSWCTCAFISEHLQSTSLFFFD